MSSEAKGLDRASLELPLENEVSPPTLHRLGSGAPAGLWITSLPWQQPRSAGAPSLNGRPTHAVPLGQWPDREEPTPRRWLLVADGGNEAPAQLELQSGNPPSPQGPPEARMVRFHENEDERLYYENHVLCLTFGSRTLALALGLRRQHEHERLHWWEQCNLVVTERTEHCVMLEMGGAIPVESYDGKVVDAYPSFRNPYLHKHNWLNGHLFVRAHANGVCEVYARHVNARFADDGAELDDAVPVIGMRVWEGEPPATLEDGGPTMDEGAVRAQCGPWTGETHELSLAGVSFDLSEAALLASEAQPGRMDLADDMLVWQPYTGVEIYAGNPCAQQTGDPYVCRAEEHRIPRGAARTVRFSLSLSDRSPRVVRYLPEAWWYGHLRELWPMSALPVTNPYETSLEEVHAAAQEVVIRRGFEVGCMPRNMMRRKDEAGESAPKGRRESGWEGEVPYTQLLDAWRTQDAGAYDWAMRAAYHFSDVVVDHARKLVRMHGYPPHALSLPMMRAQAPIAAYLETGDPHLLQTGEAVVESAFRVHRNSWPRNATGRDAAFIRSAVYLWRYFANPHFREIARQSIHDVIATQREDGSFGQQGGGTGMHGAGAYTIKPWMCIYAINGILDYLELIDPNEPRMREAVRKLGDWVLEARWDHGDGLRVLSYQHPTPGLSPYSYRGGAPVPLPDRPWHHEALARLLGWCSLMLDDARYLDAWAESYAAQPLGYRLDQAAGGAMEWLPWLQSRLWSARLDEAKGCIHVDAIGFGARTPTWGRVFTPHGPVDLHWSGPGEVRLGAEAAAGSQPA